MADRTVDIRLNTSANTQGATQAENSISGLKEEIRRLQVELEQAEIGSTQFLQATERLGQASARLNAAQGVVAGGLRKFGPVIQGTSYQLQDFVVQVGAGTSALQAMGQQAPQLLSLFGPGGAVAGLLVGIGAMAANAILSAKKAATDATEETRIATESIQKLAKDAVDAIRSQDTAALDRIGEANEAAMNLVKAYQDVAAAQQATNIINEDANVRMLKYHYDLAEALGLQVDEMQKIEALRAAEAAANEARARKAISDEEAKVETARKLVETRQKEADQAERAYQNTQKELELRQKERIELRERIAELERLAQPQYQRISSPMGPTQNLEVNREQRINAERNLATAAPEIRARIEKTETEIRELAKLLDPNEGEAAADRRATREALIAATQALNAQQAITNEAITQIETQIATDDTGARIESATEQQKQLSEQIKQAVDGITPQTEAQAAALETLKKRLEDNRVTTQETAEVALAMQTLGITLNQNFQTIGTTTQKIIADLQAVNRRLKELEARTGQVINR